MIKLACKEDCKGWTRVQRILSKQENFEGSEVGTLGKYSSELVKEFGEMGSLQASSLYSQSHPEINTISHDNLQPINQLSTFTFKKKSGLLIDASTQTDFPLDNTKPSEVPDSMTVRNIELQQVQVSPKAEISDEWTKPKTDFFVVEVKPLEKKTEDSKVPLLMSVFPLLIEDTEKEVNLYDDTQIDFQSVQSLKDNLQNSPICEVDKIFEKPSPSTVQEKSETEKEPQVEKEEKKSRGTRVSGIKVVETSKQVQEPPKITSAEKEGFTNWQDVSQPEAKEADFFSAPSINDEQENSKVDYFGNFNSDFATQKEPTKEEPVSLPQKKEEPNDELNWSKKSIPTEVNQKPIPAVTDKSVKEQDFFAADFFNNNKEQKPVKEAPPSQAFFDFDVNPSPPQPNQMINDFFNPEPQVEQVQKPENEIPKEEKVEAFFKPAHPAEIPETKPSEFVEASSVNLNGQQLDSPMNPEIAAASTVPVLSSSFGGNFDLQPKPTPNQENQLGLPENKKGHEGNQQGSGNCFLPIPVLQKVQSSSIVDGDSGPADLEDLKIATDIIPDIVINPNMPPEPQNAFDQINLTDSMKLNENTGQVEKFAMMPQSLAEKIANGFGASIVKRDDFFEDVQSNATRTLNGSQVDNSSPITPNHVIETKEAAMIGVANMAYTLSVIPESGITPEPSENTAQKPVENVASSAVEMQRPQEIKSDDNNETRELKKKSTLFTLGKGEDGSLQGQSPDLLPSDISDSLPAFSAMDQCQAQTEGDVVDGSYIPPPSNIFEEKPTSKATDSGIFMNPSEADTNTATNIDLPVPAIGSGEGSGKVFETPTDENIVKKDDPPRNPLPLIMSPEGGQVNSQVQVTSPVFNLSNPDLFFGQGLGQATAALGAFISETNQNSNKQLSEPEQQPKDFKAPENFTEQPVASEQAPVQPQQPENPPTTKQPTLSAAVTSQPQTQPEVEREVPPKAQPESEASAKPEAEGLSQSFHSVSSANPEGAHPVNLSAFDNLNDTGSLSQTSTNNLPIN